MILNMKGSSPFTAVLTKALGLGGVDDAETHFTFSKRLQKMEYYLFIKKSNDTLMIYIYIYTWIINAHPNSKYRKY